MKFHNFFLEPLISLNRIKERPARTSEIPVTTTVVGGLEIVVSLKSEN